MAKSLGPLHRLISPDHDHASSCKNEAFLNRGLYKGKEKGAGAVEKGRKKRFGSLFYGDQPMDSAGYGCLSGKTLFLTSGIPLISPARRHGGADPFVPHH
jgi:hypothetical protein